MSVLFIQCEEFKKLLGIEATCCRECHVNDCLIYVVPQQEGVMHKNGDFTLCIEGQVCCKLYDKVRALPRTFWVEQAEKHGVRRLDIRGYVYTDTPERNTGYVGPKGKRKLEDPDERVKAGGLSAFLGRRRT